MYHDVLTINHNPIIRIQAVNTAKKNATRRGGSYSQDSLKKVYIIYYNIFTHGPRVKQPILGGTNVDSTLAIFVKLLATKRYPQIAA